MLFTIPICGCMKNLRHIPMIDFECSCSEVNFSKVIEILAKLDEKKGFLFESGRSYHYYGINLFSPAVWQKFMESCKQHDIIGEKWPQHQLDDGFLVLRISTSTTKPCLPKVIAKVGDFQL